MTPTQKARQERKKALEARKAKRKARQSEAQGQMSRALNYFVGQNKAYSVESVLELLNIEKRQFYKYMRGEADPSHYERDDMDDLFGPMFVNMRTINRGFGVFSLSDPLPSGELVIHASEFVSVFTKRNADGIICHRDARYLYPITVDMIAAAASAANEWGKNDH